MAIITFAYDTGTVPATKFVDAICTEYNYSATLADGSANPETKAAFAKRMVRRILENIVKNQDIIAARAAAEAAIIPITLS